MEGTREDDLKVTLPRTVRRILVPLDFSEGSLAALEYAVALARQLGADITLLHIVQAAPLPLADGFYEIPSEASLAQAEKAIAGLAKAYAPAGGEVAFATHVGTGIAELEICRAAREREIDLMVVNSHGYTGVRLALLGGIASGILQHAPCPVLVVRRDASSGPLHPRLIREVLVPTDFSPRSERAIHCASTVAKGCRAAVSLVHVVEQDELDEEMGAIGSDFAAYSTDVHCRLGSLQERTLPEGVRGGTYVRRGKAFAGIVAEATARGFDLIVLTTHGRSGLMHLLLGSTAERVIHHAPCPVLVVRDKRPE